MKAVDKTDMDAEDVLEEETIRNLNIYLKEETATNLMELMGMMGTLSVEEAIDQIISRTHNRETNNRSWKSRVADRRKMYRDEIDEIDSKLKKISQQPNWKKIFFKPKISKLKKKKKEMEIKLEEQLKMYRMVSKIE